MWWVSRDAEGSVVVSDLCRRVELLGPRIQLAEPALGGGLTGCLPLTPRLPPWAN